VTQQPDPAARPAVFVLFGATGDLARRMVLPAFYRLACEGLLPRQWLLVGNGRGDITHQDFRARVHDALTEFGPKPGGQGWDSFAQQVFFAGGGSAPAAPVACRRCSARRARRLAAARSWCTIWPSRRSPSAG
jgi:glucose-6-phosphate 1-dehydrogenase